MSVSLSNKKGQQYQNPQTGQLRNLVRQYFYFISSSEKIIQSLKQLIILNQKFNPLILFDLISEGKKYQTKKNWRKFLVDYHIHYNQQQLSFIFKRHKFKNQVIFDQFLQFILPFNTDALRSYNKSYIKSIQQTQLQQEVQQLFKQLVSYWIQTSRKVIGIKRQLARAGTRKKVESLIKRDLIIKSPVRQSGKYKQKFASFGFQLGYNQIRKFLQVWEKDSSKNLQFQILHIKRYFQDEHPLQTICSKVKKSKNGHSRSISKGQEKSISQQSPSPHTRTQSLKKKNNNYVNSGSGNRYDDFKSQLLNQLRNNSNKLDPIQQQIRSKTDRKKNSNIGPDFKNNTSKKLQDQQLRDIRYARDRKAINGNHIVQFFKQIGINQQKLQQIKKKLANNNNFFLINLYNLIDHKNQGYITARSIEQFLGADRVDCSELVKYYSRGKQRDKLRSQDFYMIFRPLSKKLNEILDSQPPHKVPNPFKKQTMTDILQVIKTEAKMLNNLQQIKVKINNQGKNPRHLFKYVDLQDKGYITSKDIKNLLQQKNVMRCEERDQKLIMKFFMKKVEHQIDFKEFQKFIDL